VANKFNVGDKVQLITGGVVMTVEYTFLPMLGKVWCSWVADGEKKYADFGITILKSVARHPK
jgi:uncharacterized protein YodC (DUF2158 family)